MKTKSEEKYYNNDKYVNIFRLEFVNNSIKCKQ